MRIIFPRWNDFNPRNDVKKPTWFRFEHSFFEHPDFYDFGMDERAAFIYLLCQASKSNSSPQTRGSFTVNEQHFHRSTGSDKSLLHRTITKLKQLQIIEVRTLRGRYANVTDACPTNDTDVTNERNETYPRTRTCAFDFEILYQKFPKKMGKSAGLKKCRKEIKTQEDHEALAKAIDKFCEHHRQTDPKYIPHFSTFMSSWRDWLDPACGTASIGKTEDAFSFLKGDPA